MLYNKNFIYFYLFLINSFINFATCEGTISSVDNPYTSKIIGISLFIGVALFCIINNKEFRDINPDLINFNYFMANNKVIEVIKPTLEEMKSIETLELEKSYLAYCAQNNYLSTDYIFNLTSGKVIAIPSLDIRSLVTLIQNLKAETLILADNKICTKVFLSPNNCVGFTGDQTITLDLEVTKGILKMHHTDLVDLSTQLLSCIS